MNPAAPLAPSSSAPANADFLLETIVRDTQATALQIATLTVLMSAAARAGDPSLLRSCRHLIYDDSKVSSLALRYGGESGLSCEAVKALEAAHAAVADGKRELSKLMKTASGVRRDALQGVSGAWRRLAGVMLNALDVLQGPTRGRLASVYFEDSATLRQFLKDAADGGAHYLDETGVMHAPPLRQRRQNPRLVVNISCALATSAGAFPATITDISRSGIGVVSDAALNVGDNVAIKLENDRELAGVVARCDGSAIGLALRELLSSNDPLFLDEATLQAKCA